MISGLVQPMVRGMVSGLMAGSADTSFDPRSVAGLSAWFDADDAATITAVAGAVAGWNDKSGNLRHLTQTATAQKPTTGSATINGRNAIAFDVNDVLTLGANTIAPGSALTVFAVVNLTSAAATRYIYSGAAAGAPQLRTSITTGTPAIVRQAQANLLTGSVAVPSGTPCLITARSKTAGNTLWVDETQSGNNATNPAYTQPIQFIGAASSLGSEGWLGSIAEILVYTTEPSIAEINAIGDYLAQKWLSNFSSGFSGGFS